MLALLLLLLPLPAQLATGEATQPPTNSPVKRSFAIEDDMFVRNGAATALLSGSMHYTRVHPHYWQDRLVRLRAMGLNTVCTYVPWMLHQRAANEPPSFEGPLNLVAFLREAQDQVRQRGLPY